MSNVLFRFLARLLHYGPEKTAARPLVCPEPPVVTPSPSVTNSIGMKLILVLPGEFAMGSPDSDSMGCDGERPAHRVRITKPFYLGAYPVTQAEYERVMGSNPSDLAVSEFGSPALRALIISPNKPVNGVSWEDAHDFCRRLSALPGEVGRAYCLPTEAQWEYACRAGSTTRWCFGDDDTQLGDYAWFSENSGMTQSVGQKRCNRWALYDMHGNVWEWCADLYAPYAMCAEDAPQVAETGSGRMCRGGGANFDAKSCRSAVRRSITKPGYHDVTLGFRVAMTVAE